MILLIRAKHLNLLFIFLFLISFSLLFWLQGPWVTGNYGPGNLSIFVPADLLIYDSWYAIYLDGKYIGYSHSVMKTLESSEDAAYVLSSNTLLDLPIFDTLQSLNLASDMFLDKNYRIKSAMMSLHARPYFLKAELKQKEKSKYQLILSTDQGKINREIELPNQLLNSSLTPLALSYIPRKRKISFSFYDPIMDKNTAVDITRRGKTTININDKDYAVNVFDLKIGDIRGTIYTDPQGYLVKQEFLGFEFIREDIADLFKKKLPRDLKRGQATFLKKGKKP